MSDTPTTNWCTFNPAYASQNNAGNQFSEGSLKYVSSGAAWRTQVPTFGSISSGKWYWEWSVDTADAYIGIIGEDVNTVTTGNTQSQSGTILYYSGDGSKRIDNVASSYGSAYSGATVGVALDKDNNTITFYRNGTTQGTINLSSSSVDLVNKPVRPAFLIYNGTSYGNFGQREFANPPGTIGATDYFNTVTYTGNSSTQSITGVGFQPDFVFLKSRTETYAFYFFDAVRGAGKYLTNNTNAETDGSTTLSSFDSDGFSLGSASGSNNNNGNYVAWCFKAGGTAVSNTDGTLTSSVSANQDAGFSIATYTGTGSNASVGHGLGITPSMCIIKQRNTAQSWWVWHQALGNNVGANNTMLELNGTAGAYPADDVFRGFTSTVFQIGADSGSNTNGGTYVAYCFAEKPGISKFGEYTGTGSSDGPVITCGFRPAMVMIKWYESVNTAESWHLYDNKRGGNPNNTVLFPDAAAVEESPADRYIQFTSDGFQLKSSGQAINRSGAKYIFMAWAATFTGSDDFKSLNTANLPAPDIKDGSQYFDTKLYTANNQTAQTITGLGFSPDLLWFKPRSRTEHHYLYDQVRGAGNRISSSQTIAEVTGDNSLTAFTSDGFSLGVDRIVNYWAWDAGGTGSSNTDGSITSTVSANPSAGFSIATYTGTGTAGTVGHGLGVAPRFAIVRKRSGGTMGGGYSDWLVYSQALVDSGAGSDAFLYLNTTGATSPTALPKSKATASSAATPANGSTDGPFV
jgi:hypothetical protein